VPTLLEAAGVPVPPHVQGRSLLPLLEGADAPVRDSALMEFTGWKALTTQHFRYVAHADGREFLYDLQAPWGEYRDVSGDPAYAGALAEHRRWLVQRVIAQEQPLPRVWPY